MLRQNDDDNFPQWDDSPTFAETIKDVEDFIADIAPKCPCGKPNCGGVSTTVTHFLVNEILPTPAPAPAPAQYVPPFPTHYVPNQYPEIELFNQNEVHNFLAATPELIPPCSSSHPLTEAVVARFPEYNPTIITNYPTPEIPIPFFGHPNFNPIISESSSLIDPSGSLLSTPSSSSPNPNCLFQQSTGPNIAEVIADEFIAQESKPKHLVPTRSRAKALKRPWNKMITTHLFMPVDEIEPKNLTSTPLDSTPAPVHVSAPVTQAKKQKKIKTIIESKKKTPKRIPKREKLLQLEENKALLEVKLVNKVNKEKRPYVDRMNCFFVVPSAPTGNEEPAVKPENTNRL